MASFNSRMIYNIFLFLLLNYNSVECTNKKWLPNINYEDPKSWEKSKLPCPQDTIIFPEYFDAALTLPKSIKVDQIVMPNQGYLLMESDSVISFDKENLDSRCRDHSKEEVTFKQPKVDLWFLSKNWLIIDSDKKEMIDNPAVPHEVDYSRTIRFTSNYIHLIFSFSGINSM